MRILKQFDCNVPEWAIPYIEYGYEGPSNEDGFLNEEGFAELEAWLKALREDGYTSPTFDYHWDSEHNGFYSHPEFGLGAGCIRTTVTQFANE